MNNDIVPFSAHHANRIEILRKLKDRTHRRIFGYFCSQIPEEILYAAGILPVRMLGNNESCEQADSLLQTYVCSFSRNCLAMMLNGDYKFLDGMVVPHTCDTIRGVFGIIQENIPLSFNAFIRLPISPDTRLSRELILEEYKILSSHLGRYTGTEIRDKDLKNSILIYNSNRRLLKQLSAFRTSEDRKLTGAEFLEVCLAGFSMDKEEHNRMLAELLEQIKDREPSPPGKVRVLVGGNVLDNAALFKIIEDLGADVVYDDLCTGTRYFDELVNEQISDPMDAIVDHYVRRTVCPCKTEGRKRTRHLVRLFKESHAQGIILLQQKFCDPHLWDHPLMKMQMDKEGIPLQLIEYEQPIGNLDVIKNRVQSFIEMIGG